MAEYLIQDTTLDAIADAINAKTGGSSAMTPAQMVEAIASITGNETLSWHQCPEAVRNYLAAALAAYPSNGGATIVDQYAPNYINIEPDVSRANSKPIGYTVDGVTFYDNEPLIAEPFSTASKAGTLTALDWLRWYNTTLAAPATGSDYKRGYNCRDIGGWPCDGGTVKYGMLVRGSEPNPVDRDLMVGKIGIMTEVQLLPLSEQATDYQMKSPWGIDWDGNDTESESVYNLDNPTLWKKILTAIMDSVLHSKPVYFHCGVGADRTGVVALMLEGILGVSRDNVDIEYELTDFALGWHTVDNQVFRSRSYSSYQSLMAGIASIPLVGGLSDTFRNRCVSFALSLGITIDEINAFRSAMIDGTPEVITPTLTTYTITRNGANVTFSNQTASVRENESYSVTVTANSGYKIDGVVVTMGGVDVSNYYSDGVVSIPSVTGNVIITASSSVKPITNLADPSSEEWKSGYRINGSNAIVSGQSQVTNLIPVAVGDVIRIKNAGSSATMTSAVFQNAESASGSTFEKRESYDSTTNIATFTITSAAYPYARWSIPNSQITDVNAIIITRNEEIIS